MQRNVLSTSGLDLPRSQTPWNAKLNVAEDCISVWTFDAVKVKLCISVAVVTNNIHTYMHSYSQIWSVCSCLTNHTQDIFAYIFFNVQPSCSPQQIRNSFNKYQHKSSATIQKLSVLFLLIVCLICCTLQNATHQLYKGAMCLALTGLYKLTC